MAEAYTVVERPTREIKARRFSVCALRCGRGISPGQRIGKIRAGWAHMSCIAPRDPRLGG